MPFTTALADRGKGEPLPLAPKCSGHSISSLGWGREQFRGLGNWCSEAFVIPLPQKRWFPSWFLIKPTSNRTCLNWPVASRPARQPVTEPHFGDPQEHFTGKPGNIWQVWAMFNLFWSHREGDFDLYWPSKTKKHMSLWHWNNWEVWIGSVESTFPIRSISSPMDLATRRNWTIRCV